MLSVVCSFWLLSGIPWSGSAIVCLICPSKDIWVVSNFQLLQTNVLCTFIYKVLYGHKLSFLWSKCSWVWLLGHMVNMYFAFSETAELFFRVTVSFYILTSHVWGTQFSTSLPALRTIPPKCCVIVWCDVMMRLFPLVFTKVLFL